MGLQFLWIEANLLGFFLVDVRNSRGKFDEIKEKFVINPAPIASQSSLNVGGTRWTRDLPRNSLNFFTSRSKVEEQRREIHGFKEKFKLEIVGDGGDRGGGLMASRGRFHGHGSWLQFRDESAWFQLQFRFTFATIFAAISATITPRSGRDRASIVVITLLRSPSVRPATIPRRTLLDCGSIAPRSRFDQAAIVEFFHTMQTPLDRNPTLHRSSRIGILLAVRSESYAPAMWPLDPWSQVDWTASVARSRGRPMEIAWSSARRRSDAHDASTWWKICPAISSLKRYFRHVFWSGDRVDSGPRDRRPSIWSSPLWFDLTPAKPPRWRVVFVRR